MLRPSAKVAKAQALAAASISPPLRSISGKARRATLTAIRIPPRRRSAGIRRNWAQMALPARALALADSVIGPLRLADDHPAEQAGRTQHEDDDQDREDDDARPASRQQLSAERFDQ